MSSSASASSGGDGRGDAVFVIVLTAVCFGLLAAFAGNTAYTPDESISLAFTQESWARLFGDLWVVDTHRPVYYALQKAWNEAFGTGRLAVNLLNVTLGALAVPLVWLIGRRLGGPVVGRLSALFLVLSPMFVAQSREARMYPLMNLSILAATVALVVLLDHHARRRVLSGGRQVALWAVVVITTASAIYAHATAVIFPALVALVVTAGVAMGWLGWRALRDLALAGVALVAVSLPALAPMLFHVGTTLNDFWIPAPTLDRVYSQFLGAYPYPAWAKPVILLALVWGFVQAGRHSRMAFILLFAFVVLQPLTVLALSFAKPILIVRVIVWPTLFAAVVMAFAVAALGPRLRWITAAGLVGLQALASLPQYQTVPQETDFDRLAPAFDGFDPATDLLVLGVQDFEYALRWSRPELLDARIIAFNYADRPQIYGALARSRFLRRDEAATVPVEARRLWILREVRPRFPIPPEDQVDAALDAVAAGWETEQSTEDERLRLDVMRPAGP